MFTPTDKELKAAGDLFQDLLIQGRKLMRSGEARADRLREQQEESQARSAAAAARAMERFQWRPRASVALVETTHCTACGSDHTEFKGFGVSMFRNSDAAERLVITPMLDPAFPRETHFTHTTAPACIECVHRAGFFLENSNGPSKKSD